MIDEILSNHGLKFEDLLNLEQSKVLETIDNLSEENQQLLKNAICNMDQSVFHNQELMNPLILEQ